MNTASDARRGMALCLLAVLVLALDVFDGNRHFAAIASIANIPATSQAQPPPGAIATPRHVAIMPHALDSLPTATEPAIGFVDDAALRAGRLYVRGWIAMHDQHLADHVVLLVDGRKRYEVTQNYGEVRSDVATALQNPDLSRSGIETTVSVGALRPGKHVVTMLAAGSDARSLEALPAGKTFMAN